MRESRVLLLKIIDIIMYLRCTRDLQINNQGYYYIICLSSGALQYYSDFPCNLCFPNMGRIKYVSNIPSDMGRNA